MKRIQEYLTHPFKKGLLRDLRKGRDILRHVLHMKLEPVRIRFILCRRGFHDPVKNSPFTGKMIVKRGCFDTHRLCDLSHADGIVSPRRE